MTNAREILLDLVTFTNAQGEEAYEHLLWLWQEVIPVDQISAIFQDLSEMKVSYRIGEKFQNLYGMDPFFGMI